jgi:hypothetical protein
MAARAAPVALPVERVLSPTFHGSVFRFAPWRILGVNWCLPNHTGVEAAVGRVTRVTEVQLGDELRGNVERSSAHRALPPQELFWQCVRAAPALLKLEKLVICSALAPVDVCARLRHLPALHTLHIDAGYDRTRSPSRRHHAFLLSGVDQLLALTDLSYPEPQRGSSLLLEDVARCVQLQKLCVLDLSGSVVTHGARCRCMERHGTSRRR